MVGVSDGAIVEEKVGVKVGKALTDEGPRVSFVEVGSCDGIFVKTTLVGVSVGELLEMIVVGEVVTDEG